MGAGLHLLNPANQSRDSCLLPEVARHAFSLSSSCAIAKIHAPGMK